MLSCGGESRLRLRVRLSWIGLGLAGVQVLVGALLAFTPNLEGWAGGILFALFYAVPTALIALSLRSGSRWVSTLGAWVALLLAVFFVAIPIGNWSGYSPVQATFAVSVTIPVAVFNLAAFWAVVLRRGSRARPLTS